MGVGGVAVAGTGTGLGIYYANKDSGQSKSHVETGKPRTGDDSASGESLPKSALSEGTGDASQNSAGVGVK